MGKKSILSLVLYVLIAAIIALLAYNVIKKQALLRAQREMQENTKHAILTYKKLGFPDNSELIQLLLGRLQRLEQKNDQLYNQIIMTSQKSLPIQNKKQLQQIVSLNKKMLQGYLNDVQELRRLGLPASNDIIIFSHDKIVRLSIALAELERQLNMNIFNTHTEYTQRLVRMQEISQQSIELFKQELQTSLTMKSIDVHEKIEFVKTQITQKMRILFQLEQFLAQS